MADLPLPARDASLLDLYFAARLAAMTGPESTVQSVTMREGNRSVAATTPRQAKSKGANAPLAEMQPGTPLEPAEVAVPPQRISSLNPPLRAIKDD